jgi:hypothetical protein
MEIVLGVSVTTTTVRMVLIEGENADGLIIECATFDTAEGAVKAGPSERVSAAVLATQQNAVSNGHHLVLSGVAWDDERASAELTGGNAARDLQNVVLVSRQDAAGALARTVGRALGYATTAVIVISPDTATLSVVDSDDGSIVEAQLCTLDRTDVTDILPEIAEALGARNPKPGSVFVVGSESAVCSVKAGLEKLIGQPIIVPEEPEFALARGAALAAANVPCADASTCGLAYSRDPDELSAADRFSVKPADADTQAAVLEPIAHDGAGSANRRAVPWPPISFSSAVAATLVVGGVSVAMLVAANVAGTANRGAVAAEAADSSALLPATPVASPAPAIPAATVSPVPQQLPVAPPVPEPAPAPTLPKPAVQEGAPLVQVRQPVPSRVITEPAPVAVEKPLEASPAAVDPEPVEALPAPAPALALPVFTAPSPAVSAPPIYPAPAASPASTPPVATSPWTPPWLRIGTPQSGQQTQPARWPQQFWPGLQINLWPQQQESPPQLTPQVPQSTPAQIPQWTPSPVPQWTPAPVVPQWTPNPSLHAPQVPATSRSPYPYPTLREPSTSGAYLLPPAGLQSPVGGS